MAKALCAVAVVLAAVIAAQRSLSAQVLLRPERPIRGLFGSGPPPDPDRPWQSLDFTSSMLGGYEDNINPNGLTQPGEPGIKRSGYTGYADAALLYRRGQPARVFELSGRGYVNAFRNVGLTPSYGGLVRSVVGTSVGQRHRVNLTADAWSDPFYSLSSFGPLRGDVQRELLPDANPLNSFLVRRSWGTSALTSITSNWSRRDDVDGRYYYRRRAFADQAGDTTTHGGTLAYRRTLDRYWGVRAAYGYQGSSYSEASGTRHASQRHEIPVGFWTERPLSATRHLRFSVGAGPTYIQTTNRQTGLSVDNVLPSGYASLRVDLARTWSVWVNYRRSVEFLEGLSPESFAVDATLVRIGGQLHPRAELTMVAAFSSGLTAAGAVNEEFDSYSTTSQLQFRITQWSAAVVSHTFYVYELNGVQGLPLHLRARTDRNAIRVGVNVNLPLYGAYVDRRSSTGRRD